MYPQYKVDKCPDVINNNQFPIVNYPKKFNTLSFSAKQPLPSDVCSTLLNTWLLLKGGLNSSNFQAASLFSKNHFPFFSPQVIDLGSHSSFDFFIKRLWTQAIPSTPPFSQCPHLNSHLWISHH